MSGGHLALTVASVVMIILAVAALATGLVLYNRACRASESEEGT
jgi:hypothetical protein